MQELNSGIDTNVNKLGQMLLLFLAMKHRKQYARSSPSIRSGIPISSKQIERAANWDVLTEYEFELKFQDGRTELA